MAIKHEEGRWTKVTISWPYQKLDKCDCGLVWESRGPLGRIGEVTLQNGHKTYGECRVSTAEEAGIWSGSYTWAIFCFMEFREISWILGKKQGMPHDTLEASSFEDPKVLLITQLPGCYFKGGNLADISSRWRRAQVFCKVNCFCGTQLKWDVILALLGILKISD